MAAWFARRRGVPDVDPAGVLPTIGSKELVAWLPTLLGLGPGDVVVLPEIAYPTYDVGARLAGATPVAADGLTALGPQRVRLVWLNSPSNPTGRVLPPEHLRKVVSWARERGAVVASDECYAELGWEGAPTSVLHPDVTGGSHDGLLAVYSLSKQSNLAGYRAGVVAGDVGLVRELLEVRRHAGMIVPAPVQAAMVAALGDDAHVAEQRQRYRRRRDVLRPALESGRLPHRRLPGRALPLGDPRRGLLGVGAPPGRPRDPGGAGVVLRSGRRAARAGRAHRDRRADRRRSHPPQRSVRIRCRSGGLRF